MARPLSRTSRVSSPSGGRSASGATAEGASDPGRTTDGSEVRGPSILPNSGHLVGASEEASGVAGPSGAVRLQSSLRGKDLAGKRVGHGSIDVETEDGQLVGRVSFEVTE